MYKYLVIIICLYSCFNTSLVETESYLIDKEVLIEIPIDYKLDTSFMGLWWRDTNNNYIYISNMYEKERPNIERNLESEKIGAKKLSKKRPNLEGRYSTLHLENLDYCFELEDRNKNDIEMVGLLVLNNNMNIRLSFFKSKPYNIEKVRNEYLAILKSIKIAKDVKSSYRQVTFDGFGY